MALGAISQQILKEVEAVTGRPVFVDADDWRQAQLLPRVQIARHGMPIHQVSYNLSAVGVVGYVIAFQCSFVLRLCTLPEADRLDLDETPKAQAEALNWATTHPASALPPAAGRPALRSYSAHGCDPCPLGFGSTGDIRTRFPELRESQEQAIHPQMAMGIVGFNLGNGRIFSNQSSEGDIPPRPPQPVPLQHAGTRRPLAYRERPIHCRHAN